MGGGGGKEAIFLRKRKREGRSERMDGVCVLVGWLLNVPATG